MVSADGRESGRVSKSHAEKIRQVGNGVFTGRGISGFGEAD